jgi:Ca2+-binding RTX toxin-like protein
VTIINGDAGNNMLTGTKAADLIDGGLGIDTMTGLAGNDTYIVDNTADLVVEAAGQGTDLVKSSVSYALDAEIENLTLTGKGDISATGNALANILVGNDGKNTLDGLAGADSMNGGKGDDLYYVDDVKDKVIESIAGFSGGYDTVISSVDFSLAKLGSVEALTLLGTGNLKAVGNALGNTIYGNDGDNVIDGGKGNDFMAGGKGDDTYYYDHPNDYAKELLNEGNDTIISSLPLSQMVANVENYTFNTSAKITFSGDTGDNIIKGGSGADSITGGGGEDHLFGNAGNDTLTGVRATTSSMAAPAST